MAFSITDPEELRRRREALWGPDESPSTTASRQTVLNDWDLPPSPVNQAGPVGAQRMDPSPVPIPLAGTPWSEHVPDLGPRGNAPPGADLPGKPPPPPMTVGAPSSSPYTGYGTSNPPGAPTWRSGQGLPPVGAPGSDFANPSNTPGVGVPPLAAPTTAATAGARPRTSLEADYWAATQGLTANERDQAPLNEIAKRLNAQGYRVSLPQTDPQGRNQGLIIDGEIYRVINSANGWTLVRGSGAWGSGGGGGGAATVPLGGGAAAAPARQDSALESAVRQQLLRLLGESGQAIDVNADPRAATYRKARQRSAQDERARFAERAAASGLNLGGQGSGAFETGIQGIQEGAGEDIAGYEANLVGEEVQARRQQLMQGLELALALGARTEATALQRELANLDNTYRYAALGEQGRQFNEQSDLSWTQLEALLNRQSLLDALGQGG